MRVVERPFSDLLRHPGDVTSDLDTSDVLLRRRDEPDLRLTRADREFERSEMFTALTRAFRNLAVHNPVALGDAESVSRMAADARALTVHLSPPAHSLDLRERSRGAHAVSLA